MTTPSPRRDGRDDEAASATVRAGPFTARWDVTRAAETTLVTVHVTNDHPHDRSVRVENCLGGDILPPRRHGVAAQGWDTDGVTRTVPGGETVSLGYACHAPAAEPPISLRDSPEATEPDPVEQALRSLADHAPPRAAVGGRADASEQSEQPDQHETHESPHSSTPADSPVEAIDSAPDGDSTPETTNARAAEISPGVVPPEDTAQSPSPPSSDGVCPGVPMIVAAWFRAVDARLDTAARIDGPVADATPVIASLGGHRGVTALATTLDADARALRAVADRASALAARVEETNVPHLEGEP